MEPVKKQLSNIQPEFLLFLSKIKRLSVKEDNEDSWPNTNTVSAIAITKETDLAMRKNIDAESSTLHLSAVENVGTSERGCSYYMWKQRFPVKQENRVERRMDVEELLITLAFPMGERLLRGTDSVGVYAYLPTEMVTNFPFLIQADFLLTSSRESIKWGDKWNQGILDCVPSAFVNALISLVKTSQNWPMSSVSAMFHFLPVKDSYPKLNFLRESIKAMLANVNIVPTESNIEQKFFYKPCEVGRLMPKFRSLLYEAQKQGICLTNISSHGWYVLNRAMDEPEYDSVLDFLGVEQVDYEWYAKCIRSSNLLLGVSEDVYLELLTFIASHWIQGFHSTSMASIPLIKYVGFYGDVSLCSISESSRRNIVLCRCNQSHQIAWLVDWSMEFRCVASQYFLPKSTQEAIQSFWRGHVLIDWLREVVHVQDLNVHGYANMLINHLTGDKKVVIAYAHFLYHSFSKEFLSMNEVASLCQRMPLVDNYGRLTRTNNGVLVPAIGSKWAELIGFNPWRQAGFVELGDDYSRSACFACNISTGKQLIDFLKTHLKAADIPEISPPNVEIPTVSGPLTQRNALLLLDWIKHHRFRSGIPERFLTSVKEGSWLKSTLSGSPGYRPPAQSFFLSDEGYSKWGSILQSTSVFVDIPLVDQKFYGNAINEYKEELKTIGVMFEYGEACEFTGKHLMSLAASSSLSRSQVYSVLYFIRFLRKKFLSPEQFVDSVKDHRWLQTSQGYRSPVESVLYGREWETAAKISNIPFIDQNYYGEEINGFKAELQLLGVVIGFEGNNHLVANHLKHSGYLSSLTSEAFLLILDCMRDKRFSDKLVNALHQVKCLKTDIGYRTPGECYLPDPEWCCFLKVFCGFPLIDFLFYTRHINCYKKELKQLGVKIEFEDAVKAFTHTFKQQAKSSSITKEHALAFLECFRKLRGTPNEFSSDLNSCIREVNWLRTRLADYRSPGNCILFGPEWVSIAPITILPFIDDSNNCYGKQIYEYQVELRSMGVIIEMKDGATLVAASLWLPRDPTCILPANVLSLLKCIRILLQEKDYSFPASFQKKASQEWLKTYAGYRSPDKCCLFNPKWNYVKKTDGPFIDEEFYGSDILSYRQELITIGVAVDSSKVCSLLADHLNSLSDFTTIVSIYKFLMEHEWKADAEATRRIWIPNGKDNGKWANPVDCVLHDKDSLFGLRLMVLDKYYDRKLLHFFASAFDVKRNPSLKDYCKLWKEWETAGVQISQAQCSAFWLCVLQHWSSSTEETLATLAADLVKLPVVSTSGDIFLFDKRDAFIGDDLLLKDLFDEKSPLPVFVWYPQPSMRNLPRTKLFEIYRKIGVRAISESVQKEEKCMSDSSVEHKELGPSQIFFWKGVVRVILGFLADSSIDVEAKTRHEAVQCLLNLTILETAEPMTMEYNLLLSSGENVKATTSRMIRWHRESFKFYTMKLERAGGSKKLLEYATFFAHEIAAGVLWEKEDHISKLSELIKLAFLLDFDEEAMKYLMKSKNIEIFMEDEQFLSAAFPSDGSKWEYMLRSVGKLKLMEEEVGGYDYNF